MHIVHEGDILESGLCSARLLDAGEVVLEDGWMSAIGNDALDAGAAAKTDRRKIIGYCNILGTGPACLLHQLLLSTVMLRPAHGDHNNTSRLLGTSDLLAFLILL